MWLQVDSIRFQNGQELGSLENPTNYSHVRLELNLSCQRVLVDYEPPPRMVLAPFGWHIHHPRAGVDCASRSSSARPGSHATARPSRSFLKTASHEAKIFSVLCCRLPDLHLTFWLRVRWPVRPHAPLPHCAIRRPISPGPPARPAT